VDDMTVDGTVLRVLPDDPQKEPLVWQMYKLRLKAVGVQRPMHYEAQLRNATPPGLIDVSGQFGPWNLRNPRQTGVNGSYRFAHADLGVYKGISGILSSSGDFTGVLEHINVRGRTDTPEFAVSATGHPVHLRTEFDATVDGTTGDTLLHPVIARFGKTTLRTEGGVTHEPGKDGKTVRLHAVVENGSLADVMRLGLKGSPPMTGRVSFQSNLVIPPGDRDIVDKMGLDGRFAVAGGKFTSAATQKKVAGLSERAQGNPEGDGESDVLSNLQGIFDVERSDLAERAPVRGAGRRYSFAGHVRDARRIAQLPRHGNDGR